MVYLNEKSIQLCGMHWPDLLKPIQFGLDAIAANEFAQPIKPYLRYGKSCNRIIAMPAYVGGDVGLSGLKWIASFPGNLEKQIPRAHSVTILNEAETGVPLCIINTALISGLRTTAVSGWVIQKILSFRSPKDKLKVGVCGIGPIGQLHLDMLLSLFGAQIETINLFDLNSLRVGLALKKYNNGQVKSCSSWETAFEDADIFITCTVASERYINVAPKKGSVQLNISLRDYMPTFRKHVDKFIVDDWNEVCRENTDIERMHQLFGLQKKDTLSIVEIMDPDTWQSIEPHHVIMFNPMGMAIFDIAMAAHYYKLSLINNLGLVLPN